MPLVRHLRHWVALSTTSALMLYASDARAVDVSTQGELDAAISAGATAINIVAGNLALSSAQSFAAGTDLTVASGASLSLSSASQVVGSIGGGGIVTLGTQALAVGGNNTNSAFSGTIDMTKQGYDPPPYGIFAKVGSGTLTIDSATLTLGESYVFQGALAQTSGTTTVTYLAVGEGVTGSTPNVGALNVSGGAITFGTSLQVGDFGGQGTVNQTGGTVRVTPTCGDVSRCASMNIGNQGGVGTYNINGGELYLDGGINTLGRNTGTGRPGSSGTINLSGGVIDLSGVNSRLILGYGNAVATEPQAQGTINQSGGILRVHNGSTLHLSGLNTSTGVYNLNGGALEIGGNSLLPSYNNNTPNYQFNIGSGTIRVIEAPLVTSVNATLTGGVATIDTNGLGATWSGVLSGPGSLAKIGDGTLALTGSNTYAGGTFLNGGTLQATADNNLGAATGGLSFDGGTLQLGAGLTTARSVMLNGNGGTIDTNGFNSTFSGTIGGASSLTKAGAGSLTLAGPGSYGGATLVNAGTLQAGATNVFSPNSAYTVAGGATLDLNSFNQTIGSLAGAGQVALGSAALTAGNDNSSTVFSGAISGPGGLVKSGSGTFSLTGSSTYTGPTNVNAGILSVDGSLISPVSVGAGGMLLGNGTIGGLNAASGSVVAPGHSIGTMNVAGNVSFAPGSTYLAEFSPTGQADLIAAAGHASLTGGTVQALGAFTPDLAYTILTAQGGVSGGFSAVSTATDFAFLSPILSYTPTSVLLTLEQVRSFASAAITPNQASVAEAAGALPASSPLFQALLIQPSVAGARQAFDALSGEIHGSVQTTMLDDSRYLRQAVLGRLRQASFADQLGPFAALTAGGPLVAHADFTVGNTDAALAYADTRRPAFPTKSPLVPATPRGTDVAWWAQGVGAWGKIGSDGNAADVSRNLGGFFSGVDSSFGANWRAGIAGGYTNSNVRVNAQASAANVDTAHLAAYAGAAYGPWNLRSGVAASWSTIDTSRAILFPGFADQATARYNATTAQVFGEVGHSIRFGNIAAEPFAGLAWVHLDTDGFNERGGLAALIGSTARDDIGYSTLGARIATGVQLENGMMLTPRASFAWQHAFGDVTPGAALAFQSLGSAFSISGVPLARDAALVESGVDLNINPSVTIGVSYVGQLSDRVNDHSVKGNMSWRF
ncbi:autotransporter domain-containing protein [Bradyrhizobium sp. Ai1a-2]|uniref:autotransporter outer membrane beta-barrel domain-containing protein n=1 Tax=Bradyrhizobium sp. Ai1a-2 TaxID=196490 RepID=UPI00047F9AAF|nr:autotransporter domain-containing protein [Bradyrhizobium sp. Ai1a-2]